VTGEISKETRREQETTAPKNKNMNIAIQGVKGCYHEIAAFKYFGEREPLTPIECTSFREMFAHFQKDTTTQGVMAIENTVAGSILPNYALLMNSNMTIIGEVYQRIEHHLMSNQATTLADLTEVRSHPMAILQCLQYFEPHPHIDLIETQDTALSAKLLAETPEPTVAVIASKLAAERYNLVVLDKGIETNSRNFTRFLILQNKEIASTQINFNKASLCFKLSHETGSLSKVLTLLSAAHINLTKIQSLPVIGHEWEYLFLIDLAFDTLPQYRQSLATIAPYTSDLKILGEYQAGVKYRTV